MSTKIQSNTVSTGLAMFSMFFGAGNVVFPLVTGQRAQDQNLYAILGLLITAVCVPFLGLMAMTLFNGDHKKFFERIGIIPGFLISLIILGLIGPFGAMPRVIALSYSTAKTFLPHLNLYAFSAISCVIVYLMTYRPSRMLDILGYVLTPVLLISLAILIVKGILSAPEMETSTLSAFSSFKYGLSDGYFTMDLMGAFFFSSIVILCLKQELHPEGQSNFRKLIKMTIKASCIGASLLAIVYIGSSYVAAYNSHHLHAVPPDEIISTLAIKILGPYGGIVAIAAVSLACLTTAIALAAVFAEFLHKDLTQEKMGYQLSLILTLIITFMMSSLHFSGIMDFLTPILTVCYPSLIMLSVVNLLHQLYGFKPVKTPVFAVFFVSLIVYLAT